jgi:hypothetical protein
MFCHVQSHLGEIQANQKKDKSRVIGINLDGNLYKQPNIVSIVSTPNDHFCLEK